MTQTFISLVSAGTGGLVGEWGLTGMGVGSPAWGEVVLCGHGRAGRGAGLASIYMGGLVWGGLVGVGMGLLVWVRGWLVWHGAVLCGHGRAGRGAGLAQVAAAKGTTAF